MNLTYVIKDAPSFYPTVSCYVDFTTTDGTTIESFKGIYINSSGIYFYTNTSGSMRTVYTNSGASWKWSKESYKTITFLNSNIPSDLVKWLANNAEKLKTPYEYIKVNDHKVQVDSAIRDGNGKIIAESYMQNLTPITVPSVTWYKGTKGTYAQEQIRESTWYLTTSYSCIMCHYDRVASYNFIDGNIYLLSFTPDSENSKILFLGQFTHDTKNNYSSTSNDTAVFEGRSILSSTFNYNVLNNRPTIPTNVSQLTNDKNYLVSSDIHYNTIVESLDSITNPQENNNYTILSNLEYGTPILKSWGGHFGHQYNSMVATNSKIWVKLNSYGTTDYTTKSNLMYSTTADLNSPLFCTVSGLFTSTIFKQVIYNNGIFFAITGDPTSNTTYYAISEDGINFTAHEYSINRPITPLIIIDDKIVFMTQTDYSNTYTLFEYDTTSAPSQRYLDYLDYSNVNNYHQFGTDLVGDTNFPKIYALNKIQNRLVLVTAGNNNKDEQIIRLLVSPELTNKRFSLSEVSGTNIFSNNDRNIYYNLAAKNDFNKFIFEADSECVLVFTDNTNILHCISADLSTSMWTEKSYQKLDSKVLFANYYAGNLLLLSQDLSATDTLDLYSTQAWSDEDMYSLLGHYTNKAYHNLSFWQDLINSSAYFLIYNITGSPTNLSYVVSVKIANYKTEPYIYSQGRFIKAHSISIPEYISGPNGDDGTYILKCVRANGINTMQWVLESE